jgi:pSer/pThr/pTyr-binding forkhead associated (FHA) protein
VNREGSLFCQDCGHRLEAAATPKPAAAGTTCSACGTTNPVGMNFCKMCGTSLASKPAAAAASPSMGAAAPSAFAATAAPEPAPAPVVAAAPIASGAASKTTCPACGKQTPSGFAFCQHCGQRLQPAAAPAAAAPSTSAARAGVAATVAVTPTPPAGMPRAGVAAGVQAARVAAAAAAAPHADEEALASTIAPPPAQLAAMRKAAPAAQPRYDTIMDGDRAVAAPASATAETPARDPIHGALVSLNRDGTDGESYDVVGDAFDIGRTEGSLQFADDPYLAPRHARLLVQNGKVTLRPLDTVNGVFVRVHGAADLSPGDLFLVGKELLRYESLAPEERDPPSLVEHGVRIFGSAPREAWGRLRQLTIAGTTRDVWHLVRPELVLGREEGDVTFPDDEFMSRRHAAVKRTGPRARLEDLNSSNGTFLRLRGDREVKAGDVLRLGDQLLRLEL